MRIVEMREVLVKDALTRKDSSVTNIAGRTLGEVSVPELLQASASARVDDSGAAAAAPPLREVFFDEEEE